MDKPLRHMRRDYFARELLESDAGHDPFRLFDRWFDEATKTGMLEPNAMAVATADDQGRPSVRILLLKGCDERGFVFYTNCESRKARELEANPNASLCFWWAELERQVRIEGRVERVTRAEAEDYFRSRPRASQLGACVSQQSRELSGRDELELRLRELESQYRDGEVPCPAHWGGYRLFPSSIEFWQGRESRLHDRLLYTRQQDGSWKRIRLAP